MKALCLVFLIFGTILRLWGLETHPRGLDIDEASILYWAGLSFHDFSFPIYSPQATHWEMLPGYLYYPAYLLTGVLRLFPALIGIAEVSLFGLWIGQEYGRDKGWLAAALLCVCPWHLYYSRIVGTCTGVILFFLLTRLFTTAFVRVGGLLYYTTYRLVWIRECLESLYRRQWRRLGIALLSLLAALVLVVLSPSPLSAFFWRGTYNFTSPKLSLLRNYFHSLLLPFFPVAAAYRETSDQFMADYVHTALASSLSGPALGWGLAALCALGLFYNARKFRSEFLFLVGTWLMIGFMGPSLSRFLLVLPLLVLMGAALLEESRHRIPLSALVLVLTLIPSLRLIHNLGDTERLENLFHSRHATRDRWIKENLPGANPYSVHVVADDGYLTARFWAWRSGTYSAYPAIPVEDLSQILKDSPGHPVRNLLWDMPVPRRFAAANPLALQDFDALKLKIDKHARIFGIEHYPWGDRYLLEWPTGSNHFAGIQ